MRPQQNSPPSENTSGSSQQVANLNPGTPAGQFPQIGQQIQHGPGLRPSGPVGRPAGPPPGWRGAPTGGTRPTGPPPGIGQGGLRPGPGGPPPGMIRPRPQGAISSQISSTSPAGAGGPRGPPPVVPNAGLQPGNQQQVGAARASNGPLPPSGILQQPQVSPQPSSIPTDSYPTPGAQPYQGQTFSAPYRVAPPTGQTIGTAQVQGQESAYGQPLAAAPPPTSASAVNSYAPGAQPPQATYPHGYQGPPVAVTPYPGPPAQQMGQMSLGGPPPPRIGGQPPPVGGAISGAPPAWQQRRVYPNALPPGQAQPGAPPLLPGQQLPGSGPATAPPPGVPGVMQAPHVQPSPTSRIDPNQIPRPHAPGNALVFETRVNGTANMPPGSTSSFLVRDTGNCSPRFMRCTLNQIPCSADLLTTSGMPLSVMVQPMALMDPAEEPIQVVDFGEMGPVRCTRCKAYVNPFFRFVDAGRKFECNFCKCSNEVPREYMCNLGPDGRRRDTDERPELCKGSVEFVAPKDYMVRKPMAATFFFLVDVSLTAVATGAVAAACSAIRGAIADLPGGDRTLVGFATFDSTIHFYSLNPSLQQPIMLVVPEIQDVYTPLPSDLVVPLHQCKERLEQLLESVPTMFQDTRIADSAFGAAIQGAYLAMQEDGGRILVFQSVLPSTGLGALSSRDSDGRSTTSGEKEAQKLLQPADKVLKGLAFDFADHQVSVDLFLTTQGYVDVASLAMVPKGTGGQVYHYYPFNVVADSSKLHNDVRWNLSRPQALESVMKVRCSTGLTVQNYFGNFHRRIPGEVYLPAIDCDKTLMAVFRHDDKLQDNQEMCFQCALLYTTLSGERRVRVHTLSLPTTTVLANLFRGADLDAQFTHFLREAASEVLTSAVLAVREAAVAHCVTILHVYRKFCATASSQGQLILPEALKLLPLYILALNKSVGIRTDAKIDERSAWLAKVGHLAPAQAVPLVYPRLFALLDFLTQEEEYDPGQQGMPPGLNLSSEKLDHEGIFLMENGEDAFVWLGKGVRPELLQQLFGVQSPDEVQCGLVVLPEFDNKASKRLHLLLNEIRRQRCSFLRLRLMKRGDPSENIFVTSLLEDRSGGGMSYVEFLVYIHRQIQSRMN